MSALRQALLLTALFIGLLALAGALALEEFSRQFDHRIKTELRSRFAAIETDIRQKGLDAARPEDGFGERVIILQGSKQIRPGFHDHIRRIKPRDWRSDTDQATPNRNRLDQSGLNRRRFNHGWKYLAGPRGDIQLVIGTNLGRRDEFVETLMQAFAFVGFFAAVIAVFLGLVLGLRTQKRLSAITQTLGAVAEGDTTARISPQRSRDDLDDLALQVDDTLEQVDLLMRQSRDFSSNIAHDLKTPLARLRLRLEKALEAEITDGDSADFIGAALEQTDRIIAIFDAFLRISKLEAGTAKATFRPLDLGDIAREVSEIYEPVIADTGRKLELVISDPATVDGDRVLLVQMLANLIENAMRHTPDGTRLCLIARERQLGLSDTGPGIPAAEIENVTRPLYRLEKSRTTDGAGLGLSLVKTIAGLHNAQLVLTDNPELARGGLYARLEFA